MRDDEPNDAPEVVDVTIERTSHMTVTFDDGVVCTFGVGELRAACPCATCRGVRERGGVVWPRPGQAETIAIRDAAFTGAWGISITWTDGHDTGIYAWANLRRWWDGGRRDAIEDPAEGA